MYINMLLIYSLKKPLNPSWDLLQTETSFDSLRYYVHGVTEHCHYLLSDVFSVSLPVIVYQKSHCCQQGKNILT